MPTLHIRLLGDFILIYDEQPVTGVNRARLQALLAYLLIHRHAPQSRHHLAFLFWPDTSEEQALTNLRTALYRLRQALPMADHFLRSDSQSVQWRSDAPFTLDVADFETALAHAKTVSDLKQTLQHYGGNLLPSCYDDWIIPERERLQQGAMRACEQLVHLLETQRAYRSAIDYAQRLLQLNPQHEATYRTLMRLHAANNDRAGALQIYQRCEATLREELAAPPAPETRELYLRLLHAAAPSERGSAPPPQPPLMGRQSEWKRLQDAWFAASSGRPHCVILSGDAGIGKTRLAEELLDWTNRQGFLTAAARCYAAEGALTFAPIIDWLRTPALHQRLLTLEAVWATEAARVLPELLLARPDLPHPVPLTAGDQRHQLFEALARAMLKPKTPLLLWLDDMQWSDRDTLEWLRYLLRVDPSSPLLLVGTLRAEEFSDEHPLAALLAALQRAGQVSEVALGPLTSTETATLAAHLVERDLTAVEATQLFQQTEGNPLFVVEMMRAGLANRAQDAAVDDSSIAHPSLLANRLPLPPKVHSVLHTRLAQLSPDTRALASLAAAIGREFIFSVLARASDQDEEALVRSLDELWRRRIVGHAPGREAEVYDFTHGKLRELAYNSLSAARRHLLHRKIAQALEAVYKPTLEPISAQIANHLELAGQMAEAIPYYQRAAETAQRVYANGEAIRYYRRTLALLASLPTHPLGLVAHLHEQLGDLLHWTGEYDKARAELQQALGLLPGADFVHQAQLERKMANTWREEHRYTEARNTYIAAEQRLGEPPAETDTATSNSSLGRNSLGGSWWQEWIQIRLEIIHLCYWLGEVEESDALRPKLQAAVEQYGTPAQRIHYAQSITWLEFRRNRSMATAEVVAFAQKMLAAQQAAGNLAGIPSAQFGVGFSLLWSGNPQAALAAIQTALGLAEQTGDISLQARCLAYLAVAARQCNQSQETDQYALHSLEVATAAQMPEYIGMAKANQAWLAWLANDLPQTQALGQAALALWQQLPTGHASKPFQWLALFPLLATALRQAQVAQAIDYTQALLDPLQQRLPASLTTPLEQAIQAWTRGEYAISQAALVQAIKLAQQMRYL